MRRFFTLWASAFSVLLLFGGCAVKEYTRSEPKLITLKTWKLKFNDVGFLRDSGSALQLELFSAGQPVERFEIDGEICIREGCMRKKAFNEEYLSSAYPDTLLQNVLLARPIFGGSGFTRRAEGFEQHLKAMALYDITYRVTQDGVYFKDRVNNVLIKIKDMNN